MTNRSINWPVALAATGVALFLFTGCHTAPPASPKVNAAVTPLPETARPKDAPAPTVAAAPPAAAPVNAAPAPVPPPVRIKAGLSSSITDSDGNVWLPDQEFTDGETVERPDVQIANTKTRRFIRGTIQHDFVFTSGSQWQIHRETSFCETYDGITGPGGGCFHSTSRARSSRILTFM